MERMPQTGAARAVGWNWPARFRTCAYSCRSGSLELIENDQSSRFVFFMLSVGHDDWTFAVNMILMDFPPSSCEILRQLCNRQRTLRFSTRPTVDDPLKMLRFRKDAGRFGEYSSPQMNRREPVSNGSSVQYPKRRQAIHDLHRLQAHRDDALE